MFVIMILCSTEKAKLCPFALGRNKSIAISIQNGLN